MTFSADICAPGRRKAVHCQKKKHDVNILSSTEEVKFNCLNKFVADNLVEEGNSKAQQFKKCWSQNGSINIFEMGKLKK